MFAFRTNYCVKTFRHFQYQKRNIMASKNPVLYGDEASPPVRFVMMTASCLNIDIDFHRVDLFKSEHKTDFYTKINPLQKVPALFDGSFICDSHAIALHLCRKCKDNELYPQDLTLRTRIDEMLYFNCSTLFPIDSLIFSQYFTGKWPANVIQLENWYSALDYLEDRLNRYKWLSDDKMRLCDLCCVTTISSLSLLVPTLDRHIKVKEWMKKIKLLSCYIINSEGLQRLKGFVDNANKQL